VIAAKVASRLRLCGEARNGVHPILGCDLLDGAGHWVQQDWPEPVAELLLGFMERARKF
jgi:hypothetical protein